VIDSSFFVLSHAEIETLALSVKVATFCTLLISVPAIAVAWLLAKKEFVGKSILDGLVHIPLILPPVVPGFLLLLLFGNQGLIGKWIHETLGIAVAFTWVGAVIASGVMAFPLIVRSIRLAIGQVDARLETAAQSLGASPFKVFLTITLPMAIPGVVTGIVLAFSRSLGEFGATITFVGNIEGETRTLPLAIYTYTQTPNGDFVAMRLVLLSVLIALAAIIFSNFLERKVAKRIGQVK
jgi:molybdate transport system permease protein